MRVALLSAWETEAPLTTSVSSWLRPSHETSSNSQHLLNSLSLDLRWVYRFIMALWNLYAHPRVGRMSHIPRDTELMWYSIFISTACHLCGQGSSSVVECLPTMGKVLGSAPYTEKENTRIDLWPVWTTKLTAECNLILTSKISKSLQDEDQC